MLQKSNKWLVFCWCVAHRLELFLKYNLKATSFTDVDDMILHLYYLYKKSPKKLRQLKELVSLYRTTEFHEGGFSPRKVSGISYIHHNFFIIFHSICCYSYLCTQTSFWVWVTWLLLDYYSKHYFYKWPKQLAFPQERRIVMFFVVHKKIWRIQRITMQWSLSLDACVFCLRRVWFIHPIWLKMF